MAEAARATRRDIPRFVMRLVYLAIIVFGLIMLISGDMRPEPKLDLDAYLNPDIKASQDFVLRGTSWDYTLDRDSAGYSHLTVRETINAVFTPQSDARGIERYLTAGYDGHDTALKLASITQDGQPVDYTITREGDFWHIVTTDDHRLSGDHSYVIQYELSQVTFTSSPEKAPKIQSFSWNITGEKWLQPSAHADVTIRLGADLVAAIKGTPHYGWAWAFLGDDEPLETGAQGATQAGVTVYSGTIDETMPPFTVVYAQFDFADGTFTPSPPTPIDYLAIVAPFIPVGFGVFLLVMALVTRATVWRNARGTGVIVADNEPDPKVDVLLASRILGRSRRGLPAALLDLAVHGNLRLLRINGTSADAAAAGYYAFELVTTAGLAPEEQQLVKVVFGARAGRPVRIPANGGGLRPALQRVGLAAFGRSLREGYRRTPSGWLRDLLSWGAIATTSLQWGFSRQLGYHADETQGWVLLGIAVLSAVITFSAFTIGVSTYPLTKKGALAREHLLGVREYIRVAEQRRIQFLQGPEGVIMSGSREVEQAKLDDPLLAYAVLFNQERGWRRTLDLRAAGAMPSGWWGTPT